jgi:RNA polymerase sigma-70 factor (ECF subfamily)
MPPPPTARPPTVPTGVAVLYDSHAELVWRNLHRLGVSTPDLPDLLHEVFLTAHRRWHEFDPAHPVEAWLWGISLGLARNYRRRAFRRVEVLSGGDAPTAGAEGPSPEDALVQARTRRAIEQAIDALDPEKRAVFTMFEIEGLSGPAIAAALGIPVGTVHSRLHHARRELGDALRARVDEAPLETREEAR